MVLQSSVFKNAILILILLFSLGVAQEVGPSVFSGMSGLGIPGITQPVSGLPSLVGVESPIISDKYILMPGDRLLVTVTGSVTYSYQSAVTYEGKITINMPLAGISSASSNGQRGTVDVVDAITVSGLSLRQAQDTISKIMQRYFKDAAVKLTLVGLRSAIVFVTGEVQYPGAYNASPVERVSQVIARAGGLSPLGSKTKIMLLRGGLPFAKVDIEQFEQQGDLNANPFIESGDVIYVPSVEGLVTVRGAVFGRGEYRIRVSALTTEKERISEGTYELKPGERVFDILRKAGGVTPWADLHHCYIERLILGGAGERQRIPVDLHRVLFEADSAQNLEMANADILVVPPINNYIYVEGEVNNPGAFPYSPNLRLLDYIGQAGGPTEYGQLSRAWILRQGKRVGGKTNPLVEPGDVVTVPRYGLKWWQDYVTVLSAVGIPTASILISIIALSR